MMTLAVALAIVLISVAWQLFVYELSGRRGWNPLWLAFTTTAASALFIGAGALGYTLDRHDRFIARTAWTDHVIWSQILVGFVMAAAAAYFWRKSLRHPGAPRLMRS